MGGITAKTDSELHGSAIEGLVDYGWYGLVGDNFSKVQNSLLQTKSQC
jgi:hypothetical protein